MKYLTAEYITSIANGYYQRSLFGDSIPLDNRFSGQKYVERREPLIKHPCIHWLGPHR